MDWYDPIIFSGDAKLAHTSIRKSLITGTNLNMGESLIMALSYYVHRHFPDEFSLSTEILINFISAWIVSTFYSVNSVVLEQPSYCVGYIKIDAITDMWRCLTFVLVIYIITNKSFSYFPLPFTWVFTDFTKFLFEPTCVQIFLKFLAEKHQDRVDVMKKLMKIYSTEFGIDRSSTTTISNMQKSEYFGINTIFTSTMTPANHAVTSHARIQFLECIQTLEPYFEEFKQTESARALYTRLKEFEIITERASGTN